MACRKTLCYVLFVISVREIIGEEICYSSDLKAVMVRLRKLTTETHDSLQGVQRRVAELEQRNLYLENIAQANLVEIEHLQESIHNLTQKTQQQEDETEDLKTDVSFVARNPNNTRLDNSTVLVFTTEDLDTHDSYDVITGKFAAPVSGTYLFSAQICSQYWGWNMYYSIKSSNTTREVHAALVLSNNQSDHRHVDCSSVSTVIVLSKSEAVWVESGSNSSIYQTENVLNIFFGSRLSL